MKTQNPDVIRLLRTAALLWVVYIVALTLLDLILMERGAFPLHYYLIHGGYGLFFLGMAYWTGLQNLLGRFFLPLVIILMMLSVVVTHHVLAPTMPRGPMFSAEAMTIRRLPLLTLPIVLMAWQFQWYTVFLFSFASILLRTLLILSSSDSPGMRAGLVTSLIMGIVAITVAYFLSRLMTRLREQQQALEDANRQLAHYASTLDQLSTSRERNRIARELHDTLAHTLSGLTVQLETVKAYLDADPEAAKTMLVKSLGASRAGLEETRRALKSLRATPLEDLGLALAIRKVAEEAATRGGLTLDLSLPEQMPPLSPDIEQCVYRITQEAIANVLHHANGHCLWVTLACDGGNLRLFVRDDGIGFDVKSDAPSGHYGLAGMRERARLVGGDVTIESGRGRGTNVQLIIEKGLNHARHHL